ncbi:MAG: hypothetical protein NUW37_16460 [Planctomycetes bacterium]|nr:hypothetical protein [Planctomycetota bacterium]
MIGVIRAIFIVAVLISTEVQVAKAQGAGDPPVEVSTVPGFTIEPNQVPSGAKNQELIIRASTDNLFSLSTGTPPTITAGGGIEILGFVVEGLKRARIVVNVPDDSFGAVAIRITTFDDDNGNSVIQTNLPIVGPYSLGGIDLLVSDIPEVEVDTSSPQIAGEVTLSGAIYGIVNVTLPAGVLLANRQNPSVQILKQGAPAVSVSVADARDSFSFTIVNDANDTIAISITNLVYDLELFTSAGGTTGEILLAFDVENPAKTFVAPNAVTPSGAQQPGDPPVDLTEGFESVTQNTENAAVDQTAEEDIIAAPLSASNLGNTGTNQNLQNGANRSSSSDQNTNGANLNPPGLPDPRTARGRMGVAGVSAPEAANVAVRTPGAAEGVIVQQQNQVANNPPPNAAMPAPNPTPIMPSSVGSGGAANPNLRPLDYETVLRIANEYDRRAGPPAVLGIYTLDGYKLDYLALSEGVSLRIHVQVVLRDDPSPQRDILEGVLVKVPGARNPIVVELVETDVTSRIFRTRENGVLIER